MHALSLELLFLLFTALMWVAAFVVVTLLVKGLLHVLDPPKTTLSDRIQIIGKQTRQQLDQASADYLRSVSQHSRR